VEVPGLPAGLASDGLVSYRQELVDQRAPLLDRYQKWKTRADTFNQVYAGREFDEGSKEAQQATSENSWLGTEGAAYQRLASAFKARVNKLEEFLRLAAESERIRVRAATAAGPDPAPSR
jgi:hypothetical protein